MANQDKEHDQREISSSKYSDALNHINMLIHSKLDFDSIMKKVVVEVARTIDAESAVIYLPEGDGWIAKYIYGFPGELQDRQIKAEEISFSIEAARQRKAVVINDVLHDNRANNKFNERYGINALLDVALTIGEKVVGNFSIHYHHPERKFSHKEVDFANKAASTITLALKNALLLQERINAEEAARANEQKVLQTLDRLMILVGVSSAVLSETTIQGTLNRAVEGAIAVTDAQVATSGHGYKEGSITIGALAYDAPLSPCPTDVTFTINRGGVYMELLQKSSTIRFTQKELENHPEWWGLPEGHAPLKGLLGARLEGTGGEACGMILVSHKRRGEFTEEDEVMLTQLCQLTSLAIRHIEARNVVEKHAAELESLSKRLRVSEELFREFFANAPIGLAILGLDGRFQEVNQAYCRIIGYDREEVFQPGFTFMKVTHHDDIEENLAELNRVLKGETSSFFIEKRNIRKDGSIIWVRVSATQCRDPEGKSARLIAVVEDIHDRKQAEEALRVSEANYRTIFDSANDGLFIQCAESGAILDVNQRVLEMYKYRYDEILRLNIGELSAYSAGYTQERAMEVGRRAASGEPQLVEWLALAKDGTQFWVEVSLKKVILGGKNRLLAVVRDISERKRVLDALRQNEERLRVSEDRLVLAQSAAGIGMWNVNLQTRESTFSNQYLSLLGIDRPPGSYEEFLALLHPDDRYQVMEETDQAIAQCRQFQAMFRVNWNNGSLRWIMGRGGVFCDSTQQPLRMTGVIFDVTDRKKAEEDLKAAMDELERSNRELEQFAYIASHDLQEPLRMVAGYVKLLERRYKESLDEKAQTYINFAVDGTNRMQKLIEGLLTYSRISRGISLLPVDTNIPFAAALANLDSAIRESNARITSETLPVVEGDETQLMQLFQNLLANSLKYRKKCIPPQIYVSARREGNEWLFSVQDNGIGIERGYYDEIFQIFRRLHVQDEYQGTGIGLASCKKIVERHGGKIWVESEPGEGSTFFFTMPAARS